MILSPSSIPPTACSGQFFTVPKTAEAYPKESWPQWGPGYTFLVPPQGPESDLSLRSSTCLITNMYFIDVMIYSFAFSSPEMTVSILTASVLKISTCSPVWNWQFHFTHDSLRLSYKKYDLNLDYWCEKSNHCTGGLACSIQLGRHGCNQFSSVGVCRKQGFHPFVFPFIMDHTTQTHTHTSLNTGYCSIYLQFD